MRTQKTSKVEIKKVPDEQSKIKFQVTFTAEWDWNKDFVRSHPNDYSLADEFAFRETNFSQALINYVWNRVDGSNERLFDGAKLTSIEVSTPIINEYSRLVDIKSNKEKAELLEQLEAAEKKAAYLRDKLSK